MIEPSLEVVAAVIGRLKADASVSAVVNSRVYDAIPPEAERPYVNIGQPQVLPVRMGQDCDAGAETAVTIHAWSTGPESVEIKSLGAAIIDALDEFDLVVSGHRTVICDLEQVNYLDDPDGIVKHAAIVFRVVTEPS